MQAGLGALRQQVRRQCKPQALQWQVHHKGLQCQKLQHVSIACQRRSSLQGGWQHGRVRLSLQVGV